MPEVDNVLTNPFLHGQLRIKSRFDFATMIQQTSYRSCYVLPNSFKSALIPFFAKIPVRVGYVGEFRYPLLTNYQSLDKTKMPRMVDRYTQLAHLVDGDCLGESPHPKLKISNQVKLAVERKFIREHRNKIVCFCPGAEYGPSKMWPPKKYGELAIRLSQKGFAVLLVGSRNDSFAGQKIKQASNHVVVDLCGKTSLNEAIAILSMSNLVVTNDSGLMHVAAALDRPTVAIFGSSSPKFTPPLSQKALIANLNLSCSPCFEKTCPFEHMNCMENLDVNYIVNLINQLDDYVKYPY